MRNRPGGTPLSKKKQFAGLSSLLAPLPSVSFAGAAAQRMNGARQHDRRDPVRQIVRPRSAAPANCPAPRCGRTARAISG